MTDLKLAIRQLLESSGFSLIVGLTLAGSKLPARRTTRVNPVEALHAE